MNPHAIYWFFLTLSVVGTIGLVAGILWWAWRQETAGRYTDTLDRRFAKYKTEPKPQLHRHPEPLKAYLDWVDWRGEVEQRVTALEEGRAMPDSWPRRDQMRETWPDMVTTDWTMPMCRLAIIDLRLRLADANRALDHLEAATPVASMPGTKTNETTPTALKAARAATERTQAPTT